MQENEPRRRILIAGDDVRAVDLAALAFAKMGRNEIRLTDRPGIALDAFMEGAPRNRKERRARNSKRGP